MPVDISKNTFDPTKDYRKVVFQQKRPVMDFDFNESVDIAAHERDQIIHHLSEGKTLLGSAGAISPPVSGLSRRVDVARGVAVDAETIVHLPAQTDLRVFDSAVVSGVQTSTVYAEYRDVEVFYTDDPDIYDPALGESGARIKREVVIRVAYQATMPALTAGWDAQFEIGTVTHNFDTDGTIILSTDISQSAAPTPGELAGAGPKRPLRMLSRAPADEAAFEFDSVGARTTGDLFRLLSGGVLQFRVGPSGELVGESLEVAGDIVVGGLVDGLDLTAFKSAYDTHTHDGRYYTEAEADALYLPFTGGTLTGDLTLGTKLLRSDGVLEILTGLGASQGVRAGSFLVSDDYATDAPKVPANGGWIKGNLIAANFLIGTAEVLTGATAGTGISQTKAGNTVTITNTDRGSSQSIFKGVADAAGVVKFSAGNNTDAVQFAGSGIISAAFDAVNKRVTLSAALAAGTGIGVSGSTISNTGIVSAAAGTGISVSGTNPLSITNTDLGSSQSIFKQIADAAGTAQFSAGSNNDAVRFAGGANIAISFDALTKKVTVAGAGQWGDSDTVDGWHRDAIRDWNNLLNKPATFAPSAHSHAWADITGEPVYTTRWPSWTEVTSKPTTFAPSAHSHAWADITGEPAYTTRWPTWTEVSSKPATFPPSAHPHRIILDGWGIENISGGSASSFLRYGEQFAKDTIFVLPRSGRIVSISGFLSEAITGGVIRINVIRISDGANIGWAEVSATDGVHFVITTNFSLTVGEAYRLDWATAASWTSSTSNLTPGGAIDIGFRILVELD